MTDTWLDVCIFIVALGTITGVVYELLQIAV